MSAGITPFKTTYGRTLKEHIEKLKFAIDDFTKNGIQDLTTKHQKQARNDLQMEAPYDYEELDTYHMRENMDMVDYRGDHGLGKSVISRAPYSGLLEYGTAYHGVQYVFFRPIVARTAKAFKEDVIRVLTRMYSRIG